MKTILKATLVILVPETDKERETMAGWKEEREGHVFGATQNTGDGLSLVDLGSREDVCREPINVISASRDPRAQLISNFAHTPFDLDGEHYESVEGFWQGLRFEARAERRRIAALWGKEAKR